MWTTVFSRTLLLIFTVFPAKSLSYWELRLVDGDTPFNGRPEVYIDGWRPFCDSSLHPNVATVICRTLGMPTNNVTLKSNKYVDNWDSWIVCDEGDTDLMTECQWAIWPETDCWEDEGLSCNGNVRLLNGTNDDNGNIDFFHNGILTSICDSDADFRLAQVVCRQLGRGIGRAGITLGSYFGPGNPGTLQVACSGDEDSIERCRLRQMSCNVSHVLGVDCNATQYELEVVSVDSGRVSVNINTYAASGYWSDKISGASEDRLVQMRKIASVICYELGYSRYHPGITEIPFDERFAYPLKLSEAFVCSGVENRLSECSVKDDLGGMEYPESATPLTEIAVTCNDDLKLHGGTNNYTGILMQRDDSDGTWHTFADIRPDYAMGVVACRDLGHSSSNIEVQLKNLEGEAYTSLDVEHICSGEEPTLRDCQTNQSTVRRSKAVIALNCNAATSLHSELYISKTSGFVKRLSGRRLDGQGNLITSRVCVSTTRYDENTAAVMCHQLGYARSGAKITLLPSTEVSAFYTDISRYACTGAEETLGQCPVYEEFNESRCRFEVSMACKDVGSCIAPGTERRRKAINCHNFQCIDNVCEVSSAYPMYAAPCLVDIGQGCMVSKTYKLTATGLKLIMMLGYCNPECVSAFTGVDFEYRSDECCYTEMCNSNTTVVRERPLFRVVDGILPSEGFVQFYSSSTNEWLYVLDHILITKELIRTFCTGSGYFENTFARSPNSGKTTRDKNCVGIDFGQCNLQDLSSCFMSRAPCPEKNRLRINCNVYAPRARLVGGYSKNMGRVEIYFLERWGTVCTRGIKNGVSDVLCRSLGFHGGCSLNTTGTGLVRFPTGTGSIHFQNVSCVGNEESILSCNYSYVGKDSECTHEDDLGIICENGTAYSGDVYVTPSTMSVNAIEQVPPNTVAESSNTVAESSNTVAEYLAKFETTYTTTSLSANPSSRIRCLFGKCRADDCGGTFTGPQSACMVNEKDACFVKKLESYRRSETILIFGCMDNECTNGTITGNNGHTLTTLVHCCTSDLCNAFVSDASGEMNDSFVNMTENMSSTEDIIEWEAMYFDESTQEVLLVNANTGNLTPLAAISTVGFWIIIQMVGLCVSVIWWKL